MSRVSEVKASDGERVEGLAWVGIPPLSMQQLWFSIQKREWTNLVIVPADRDVPSQAVGRPLYEVGRLAMGDHLRLIDAREVKLTRTAPLILDMTRGGDEQGPRERALVLIESVISHPWGVPVVLAADAALLCVQLGKTSLAAAKKTLAIVGAPRFLGCIVLPPP